MASFVKTTLTFIFLSHTLFVVSLKSIIAITAAFDFVAQTIGFVASTIGFAAWIIVFVDSFKFTKVLQLTIILILLVDQLIKTVVFKTTTDSLEASLLQD